MPEIGNMSVRRSDLEGYRFQAKGNWFIKPLTDPVPSTLNIAYKADIHISVNWLNSRDTGAVAQINEPHVTFYEKINRTRRPGGGGRSVHVFYVFTEDGLIWRQTSPGGDKNYEEMADIAMRNFATTVRTSKGKTLNFTPSFMVAFNMWAADEERSQSFKDAMNAVE